MRKLFLPFLSISLFCSASLAQKKNDKAVYLENLPWSEAAKVLTADAVVVIPLGAAAKEHGRHLPLASDFLQAEHLKEQVAAQRRVVITPTINYSFYPPFLKYAGSTSLRFTTARDMVLEIVRQLSDYGPKRFYVINMGITTNAILADAVNILAKEGILLKYSDYTRLQFVEEKIRTKKTGTHADEIETSNLLFVAPKKVDMSKAVDDTTATRGRLSLSPVPTKTGSVSESGVYGYATLGTKEKGKKFMQLMQQHILNELDSLQSAILPQPEDQQALLAQYAGTFKTEDGKKLVVKAGKSHLDYTWLDQDHSEFYHLYYYNKDMYASQMMDILFIRVDKDIIKALCNFRGVQYWLIKEK